MLVKIIVVLVLVHLADQSNLTISRQFRVKRNNDVCGKPSENVASLIYGGEEFARGAWPWMVALLKRSTPEPVFFCAGTLISETKVVTAAHCIHDKNEASRARVQEIFMIFGAHNLNELYQSGTYSASPSIMHVHPEWKPQSRSFDADIAMLELEDKVPLTKLIKPICLWQPTNEPDKKEGIIAGWGQSENNVFENVPKQLKISVASAEECRRQAPDLNQIQSQRTFCGGSKDGTGPCMGDSGSGVFLQYEGKFYLRGLVSASILNDKGRCNASKFDLYTNILKYNDWIKDPSQNEEEITQTQKLKKPLLQNSWTSSIAVTSPTQTPLPALVPRPKPLEIQLEPPFSQELDTLTPSQLIDDCGVMAGTDALIRGGYFNTREIFPWTVVVYRQILTNNIPNYYNTGTLVSQKHVLVQADFACEILSSGQQVNFPVRAFTLYFGVINLNSLSDTNTSSSKVKRVLVHPSFKSGKPQEAGLAILEAAAGHDKNMVPICLWPSNGPNFIRTLGYAVGWGYDQSETYFPVRKYHQAKSEDCGNQFAEYLSTVTIGKYFCLKSLSNSVPCVNDNPFYVESDGKWYLRGIWSTGFACTPFKSTLYGDITLMTTWIQNTVRQV